MKRNRIFSLVLAGALTLSLAVTPARAASFSDTEGHWAKPYIDDVVKKKIFEGVGDNRFAPDQKITASEVLAVCARISVETVLRREIGKDRQNDIKAIMGTTWVSDGKWEGEQYWFADEYAVCLETGIVSYAELKELYQSGALSKPITKEDFVLYLVRAMQLAPMAENIGENYTLPFTDKAQITAGRGAYVYLLNMYNIVSGTDNNEFQPKSEVNRAVASKMMSKATDFMEERGTSVELPEYADYAGWEAGVIVSAVESGKGVIVLTLNSDLSGTKAVSIPAETPIYENSMLVEANLLKSGVYARVCLDSGDKPLAVRLSGSVETVSGSVVGVSEDAVLLSVNGVSQTLSYDRFTEVQVGQKVGDREFIDVETGGYTNAVCRIDQLGHMVALQLTGGSRREEALISNVEAQANGSTILTVSGFDGQLQRLTVPTGASVTSNGLSATLNSTYIGSLVTLRVSNDTAGSVVSAAVDTVTQYIQGAVKGSGADEGVDTVTVTNLTNNKATTYKVAKDAKFYYNDLPTTYGAIQKDWFVTIRFSGGELAALYGYPASTETKGTISGVTYPSGTTKERIAVLKDDGTEATFELDLLEDPPAVVRGGKKSDLTSLRTGDAVTVTVRYNAITRIEATPQSANLSGTIGKVTQTTDGVTIEVELDNDGGVKNYEVAGGVTITKDNKIISMYDLRVGDHVAMVTSGDQAVLSIEVDKTTSSTGQLSGTVITVDTGAKTILFRAVDGGREKIVTVSVPSGINMIEATGGTISLTKLKSGDALDIYGAYENSDFKATSVIRR